VRPYSQPVTRYLACFALAPMAACVSETIKDAQATDAATQCADASLADCGDSATSREPGDADACEGRSSDTCGRESLCVPIEALPFSDELHCRTGTKTFVGCRSAEAECPPALSAARDSSGQLWEVEGSCIPADFVRLDPKQTPVLRSHLCPSATVQEMCRALSADTCTTNGDCQALEAQAVDGFNNCVRVSAQHVGCIQDKPCTGAEVIARDPSNQLWKFGSGCLPVGWAQVPTRQFEVCP
jgi:hypothetical protein